MNHFMEINQSIQNELPFEVSHGFTVWKQRLDKSINGFAIDETQAYLQDFFTFSGRLKSTEVK